MTREEYRTEAGKRFPAWSPVTLAVFPRLLEWVGLALFEQEDITSPLAVETIRRLKQLNETGVTDP